MCAKVALLALAGLAWGFEPSAGAASLRAGRRGKSAEPASQPIERVSNVALGKRFEARPKLTTESLFQLPGHKWDLVSARDTILRHLSDSISHTMLGRARNKRLRPIADLAKPTLDQIRALFRQETGQVDEDFRSGSIITRFPRQKAEIWVQSYGNDSFGVHLYEGRRAVASVDVTGSGAIEASREPGPGKPIERVEAFPNSRNGKLEIEYRRWLPTARALEIL
jgi:hypothetical protein